VAATAGWVWSWGRHEGSGRAPGWCGYIVSSLLWQCCGGAVCWLPTICLPLQSVVVGEVGHCDVTAYRTCRVCGSARECTGGIGKEAREILGSKAGVRRRRDMILCRKGARSNVRDEIDMRLLVCARLLCTSDGVCVIVYVQFLSVGAGMVFGGGFFSSFWDRIWAE
jgi:hypothetical protein